MTADTVRVLDRTGRPVRRSVFTNTLSPTVVDRGKWRHFMAKEIHEQPQTVAAALSGRTYEGRVLEAAFGPGASAVFDQVRAVQIVACGTAYHAGLVARHWFEVLAGGAMPRGAGERVPVPGAAWASGHPGRGALAVRRDGGYPGGPARGGSTGVRSVSRHRERSEQLPRAGRGSRPDDQRGSGDRGRVDQGVHRPARRPAPARGGGRTAPRDDPRDGGADRRGDRGVAGMVREGAPPRSGRGRACRRVRGQAPRALPRARDPLPGGDGGLRSSSRRSRTSTRSRIPPASSSTVRLPWSTRTCRWWRWPRTILSARSFARTSRRCGARGGILYVFGEDMEGDWDDARVLSMPSVGSIVAPVVHTILLQLLAYHVAVLKGTDIDQPRNLAKSVNGRVAARLRQRAPRAAGPLARCPARRRRR